MWCLVFVTFVSGVPGSNPGGCANFRKEIMAKYRIVYNFAGYGQVHIYAKNKKEAIDKFVKGSFIDEEEEREHQEIDEIVRLRKF